MRPLAYYVRSRLRRRIFAWFGVTIVLSGGCGAGMVALSSRGEGWRDTIERAAGFVGQQFAEVWDDPVARDRLARSAAQQLRLGIELRDAAGAPLARFGAPCRSGGGELAAPVRSRGRVRGEVQICRTTDTGGNGPAVVLGVGVALMVLWGASGLIAWRLTRPLTQLVRVTQAIGRGELTSRLPMPQGPGELALLARAVNDMAERIQAQISDQRELLAVVSHEIRTPLGHMRVLLDLARDVPDSTTLQELEDELLEVDRLVDRLLASSRLEFDQIDRRPLRADALATSALARAGLTEDHLVLETDALALRGDATLLARALANLIDNANAHGGGLVVLRVRRRGARLCVAAEDAGPGLPREGRGRLFESFVRGGEGGRLGLGLALVQRIAAAHGGDAFAEDLEAGGAAVGLCIEPGVEDPLGGSSVA